MCSIHSKSTIGKSKSQGKFSISGDQLEEWLKSSCFLSNHTNENTSRNLNDWRNHNSVYTYKRWDVLSFSLLKTLKLQNLQNSNNPLLDHLVQQSIENLVNKHSQKQLVCQRGENTDPHQQETHTASGEDDRDVWHNLSELLIGPLHSHPHQGKCHYRHGI
jgi:hypothetical protein